MTPSSLREHLQSHKDLIDSASINGLPGEYALALLLMSDHQQTVKEVRLAAYFGANPTAMIKQLLARGFIHIEPHPNDRRSKLVSKTKSGKYVADKLRAKLFTANRLKVV